MDTEFLALPPDPQAAVIADVRRSGPVGLLVGSERNGLSNTMLERGTPVRIPMADGVDSLNAAAATAIACYALRR